MADLFFDETIQKSDGEVKSVVLLCEVHLISIVLLCDAHLISVVLFCDAHVIGVVEL